MHRAILLILTLSLTAGCAGRLARPRAASGLKEAVRQLRYTPEAFQADYQDYRLAETPGHARAVRDQMVYRILAETELHFRAYETKLRVSRGRLRFGSDLLQLSLASSAGIVNGERGKTILATLLSATTGASLSYSQSFFEEKTTEAILARVNRDRSLIRSRIVGRLEEPAAEYPFEAAWSDLIEFFYAGTLESGLRSLHEQALGGQD